MLLISLDALQAQCERRHPIPKMSFKVHNWPDYEADLRQRCSLTFWDKNAVSDRWQCSWQPD